MGILMPLVALGIAYAVLTMINVREVTTENDFITALLHSDGVYQAVEKLKRVAAVSIVALGLCFGIITYGLGIVLARIKQQLSH